MKWHAIGPLGLLCLLLAISLIQGLSLAVEDDLVFDDETPSLSPEVERQLAKERKRNGSKKWRPVERLLGMPDAVAAVGHAFKLHIPKQAFSGNVDYYEVKGTSGKGLVRWLRWDDPAGVLYGVPSRKDLGRHKIKVKAYGKRDDVAEDTFYIHVVPENREHHGEWRKRCSDDQERTMLTLLADANYDSLNATDKFNAVENLAGFLGLNTSRITIQPDLSKEKSNSFVLRLGPGNVHRRRGVFSTRIQWQVGCDGSIWHGLINATREIPEQARDGTLSEVLQLPVYQWRLRAEPPDFARNRRDTRPGGSGGGLTDDEDGDDEEYDDEDDQYDDYDANENNEEDTTDLPQPGPKHTPVIQPQPSGGSSSEEHPHRHHHGEDSSIVGNNEEDFIWKNADVNNAIFNSTPSSTSTSTIAVTLPSSTTTTSTSTTTTATTTTTTTSTTTPTTTTPTTTTSTEPPTTESPSPTTESTSSSSSSSSSSPTEPDSRPSFENATLNQSTSGSSAETPTTETTASTYTNLTQTITTSNSQAPSTNVSIDSLLTLDEDEEEGITTIRDIENETDLDNVTLTSFQLNVTESSPTSTAPTTTTTTTTTTTSLMTTTTSNEASSVASGSVAEVVPTEPNVTSILSVNVTGDEYTESSVPARESSSASPPTSWPKNDSSPALFPDSTPSYGSSEDMHPSIFPSTTPSTTTSTSTTTQTSSSTTTTTSTTEPSTTTSTTPSTTTTTPLPTTTTPTTTTTTSTTTSTTPLPTTSTTTERIEDRILNLPPKVERRLKKIPIMQGKLLSYTIPEDTFSDPEDGDTRNLQLKIYEKDASLKPSSWLQFNPATQEVYGLPLDGQYGTYSFEVKATDSGGLSTSDRLDIFVQQHKQSRAVNHEFHVYLKIKKWTEFPTNVDWELKVMRSLAELYGDKDLSYITVRSIDIEHDQAIYTWTNDSLVRSSTCPQEDINKLYRVLVADEKSDEPSELLMQVLGPEIRPTRVVYQGLEQCQTKNTELTKETQVNKYPVPRNQIDQLNATVGQLFVYRIPKDTFYDEEDGDTSSMKASLLTANRTEIPAWDWLQFDSRNQEFYGVPLKQDIGRKTYQLVVKDSGGLEATDSLVAEVHPAPVVRHVVQILMELNMPYETFAHSAHKKREFIQKLQRLYGDKNTSAISLLSITGNRNTTTVTWRNLTLPTYKCPHEEIMQLRRVLVNDNKSFTDELIREFDNNNQQPEFAVNRISVLPMGDCQDAVVGVPDTPPIDDSTSIGASHDDYLVTFVLPAAIIATMLTLAGLIACILYKRRRSGKMSVSEKDDERQSFRSKGIPVIFQDELEEKPDPGNKSPIILKEEKPPLPPPEYQRAEDGADIPMLAKENSEEPYQPPPPFATNRDNSRQNRPKPTPTYRKPPPYVPP